MHWWHGDAMMSQIAEDGFYAIVSCDMIIQFHSIPMEFL